MSSFAKVKLLTVYIVSLVMMAAFSRVVTGWAAAALMMVALAVGGGWLFWRMLATSQERMISSEQTTQKPEPSSDEERHLLHAMVDALPDLIYIKDTEHRFVIANRALVRHMGFQNDNEVIGKSDIIRTIAQGM